MQYLTKTGKKTVTRETRRNLLKNLIRHQLILQQALVQALRKDEEIVEKVRQYEDSLVTAKFLQKQLSDQLKQSELELLQFYKENIDDFKTPEQIEARHILLRSSEEAEDILSKLKNGEDFAQLAEQYSIDLPNALKGGEMGRLKRGDILPELEKVLFDLREGQVSGVIPSKFGYHILTVDKIIPAKARPFAEVRDEIRKAVFRQKRDKAFEQMITKLEANADIEIIEERLFDLLK
jgi:parvulin-like peptidyl-prolyl isomerase